MQLVVINALLGLSSRRLMFDCSGYDVKKIDVHHTFPYKGPPPGLQHPTWHFWLACNSQIWACLCQSRIKGMCHNAQPKFLVAW